jgi:hypothetical protein
MTALLAIELRRALARPLVRILIALALVAIAFAGVITFMETRTPAPDGPIKLTDLWPADGEDPIVIISSLFLAIGALFAGASVVGAEWRAGSIVTLLTWEPRRVRVGAIRVLVAGLAAAVIGFLLQVVFVSALLPALLAHGDTSGAGMAWFWGLAGGMARSAFLTGLAAAFGASLAMIGRNTAVALGAVFAYLNVLEGGLRAWKPSLGRWLISENVARFLLAKPIEGLPFNRSTLAAGLTVTAYVALVATAAIYLFRRRDIAI